MKRNGFTLVEVLVVVVIITILVGILMPAVSKVIEGGQKKRTLAAIKSLEMAIRQYESTYGYLPLSSIATEATNDHAIDPGVSAGANEALIGILTGGNSRGIRFLEPTDPTNATAYLDSWDQEFFIFIDTNYDGVLNNAGEWNTNVTTSYLGVATLNTSVAIISAGPDGARGGSDDIKSWE